MISLLPAKIFLGGWLDPQSHWQECSRPNTTAVPDKLQVASTIHNRDGTNDPLNNQITLDNGSVRV